MILYLIILSMAVNTEKPSSMPTSGQRDRYIKILLEIEEMDENWSLAHNNNCFICQLSLSIRNKINNCSGKTCFAPAQLKLYTTSTFHQTENGHGSKWRGKKIYLCASNTSLPNQLGCSAEAYGLTKRCWRLQNLELDWNWMRGGGGGDSAQAPTSSTLQWRQRCYNLRLGRRRGYLVVRRQMELTTSEQQRRGKLRHHRSPARRVTRAAGASWSRWTRRYWRGRWSSVRLTNTAMFPIAILTDRATARVARRT